MVDSYVVSHFLITPGKYGLKHDFDFLNVILKINLCWKTTLIKFSLHNMIYLVRAVIALNLHQW